MSPVVACIPCPTYNDAEVEAAVRHTVDLVGGMQAFVQPGQRVLLKPNLVLASTPDDAICTHPAVVKAVVKLVQEAGGRPIIGESPGGPFNRGWLWAIYHRTGIAKVAEETGAELNWDFSQSMISHPDGRAIKGLEVSSFVTRADVVISLPKLKTHGFMQLTGAVKNLFGVVPGTVKTAYHAKFPDPLDFGRMLIDIVALIKPALSIMDGIVGMDGRGPTAGKPFKIGAVLAGADSIALDVVAAALVRMDVGDIYPLQAAIERGLTTGRTDDIRILGQHPAAYNIQNFTMPGTRARRKSIAGRFGGLVKNQMIAAPYSTERCIGCGICAQGCPAKAITIHQKRATMNLDTCIRCYCCHELCPEHAVELRKPLLGCLLRV